ncbi:ABC transporter ATP-binding protein [Lactobacillus mulieris]|uniref:ATP-binding cassette domain-containing protein n=1 Tax=Lactobacillus mulieris TaxID=2508708 RepID=UPI001432A527|nr:ABC transporter ATP-binding protein [Lactobacillus mulieris]MDK6802704.1 ABC transporter ATP-binding protein [Lactobacillus mulieris]MDK8381820.1 ABC transporter ATP-binding protein [Lactobacillus mulieris]MDT9620030.1 ABC transporter ATP-binding protein [Lactobacillus mulieris]NKC41021.1 ABC transporter ATP-binding protein [Lactobacillus mulieris]
MIKLKNISKSFGNHAIFENVSVDLHAGKSYAIIGKSGSGKTTLLNIIGGLENASSGQVEIDGQVVKEANLAKFRKDYFGFIFQNYGLIDTDTVEQNLLIGLANQKISKKVAQEKLKSVLKLLDLDYLNLSQKVFVLSGGEQQRLALARVILKKPKIIFADEPTGSLDPDNAQIILKHLLNDFGSDATILVATHDPQVWKKCDYIIQVQEKNIKLIKNEGEGQ